MRIGNCYVEPLTWQERIACAWQDHMWWPLRCTLITWQWRQAKRRTARHR